LPYFISRRRRLRFQDPPAFVAGFQFAGNRFETPEGDTDVIRGLLIETGIIHCCVELRLLGLQRLDTRRQGIEFTLILVGKFLRLAGRLRL